MISRFFGMSALVAVIQLVAGVTWAQPTELKLEKQPEKAILGTIKRTAEPSPKTITLGLIPSDDPVKLKKMGQRLAGTLGSKLGVKVQIVVPKDYQGLIDDMKNKKVDYAFFTAMSFVFAEKQAAAKVLLKKVWDGPFYHSAIITKKDLGIGSLLDLKGKKFGFVDQKSTSGYLYPRVQFKKIKLDVDKDLKVEFFGNHEGAVKALVEGKVDAISVFADDQEGKKNAVASYAPAFADKVQVLWVSEPIPNDPFVVRQDFYESYPQFTHKVMFAFLDMAEDKKGNLLKEYFGISEVMMATSRQYDPVREMVRELQLKLE